MSNEFSNNKSLLAGKHTCHTCNKYKPYSHTHYTYVECVMFFLDLYELATSTNFLLSFCILICLYLIVFLILTI